MIRISDIIKRFKKKETETKKNEEEKKPFSEPTQPEASPQPYGQETPQQPQIEEPKISEVRISPVIIERGKVLDKEDCIKIYEETISLVKEIQGKALTSDALECKSIVACVDKLIEQLILGNASLLELTPGLTQQQQYLSSHVVNVCILSIKIGMSLGYNKPKLIELGSSAILHDIGMIKYMDLANQPRKLTTEEYNEIRNHPIIGSEILEKAKELPEIAIYVALQQHERIDGSGYPRALKRESINTYTKIVSLVDVYEATTHPRPYRDKYMPLEAIRKLLKLKNAFEYKLVKVLIEKIGIFPIGSLVQLNTKEIGKVTKINEGFPTRPVLNIIYDRENKKLDHTKIVDLASQHTIYIKAECLKED